MHIAWKLRCEVCGYGECQYHLPRESCHIPKYLPPTKMKKQPGAITPRPKRPTKTQFTFD